MDTEDKQRFIANILWFNQFFDGLNQLLEKIAQSLFIEFPLSDKWPYYTKSNSMPSIPPYHVIGLGGEEYAIQVFTVFDSSFLNNSNVFSAEPSFIIVKHSEGSMYAYFEDFGISIIRNQGIKQIRYENNILSGMILKNDTSFHAFQIFWDQFIKGQNIDDTIRTQIIDQISQLPSW